LTTCLKLNLGKEEKGGDLLGCGCRSNFIYINYNSARVLNPLKNILEPHTAGKKSPAFHRWRGRYRLAGPILVQPRSIDQYYRDSFSTLLSVFFIFTLFGPLFNAILRYRCKMGSFGQLLLENYLWTPMLIVFFGGLSMHLSWALICYFLSIDMQWSSTAKV
jgi:hypothetical protein